MFDLKNNDISTFLGLILLGLLIWYLTKQKKTNEGFINNDTSQILTPPIQEMPQMPIQEMPIQEIQQMPMIQEMPQMPTIQEIQQMLPKQEMPTIQEIQQMLPKQEMPIKQQMQQTLPIQEMPTIQEIPLNQGGINNFLPFDNYDDNNGADINDAFKSQNCASAPSNKMTGNVGSNKLVGAVDLNKQNVQNYSAKDFLPKEINYEWFDTDFSQAATNVDEDNLINTERYVIGINTVGQSLKNASHDIRGTIACPKFSVSPWNNSTYEPDYNIKSLS